MSAFRLLIVDDEPGIVFMIKRTYLEKGFDTFGATDGVAAIELFKKEHPEVVIIEIHMPFSKIDGIETLRQIKEIDKDTICLIFTTVDDKAKIKAAKELGALHYITKSGSSIEDLNIAVDEAVDIIKKRRK